MSEILIDSKGSGIIHFSLFQGREVDFINKISYLCYMKYES